MIHVLFLGTGTSTGVPEIGCHCAVCRSDDPREKRLRASVLLEQAEKRILIDCGPDFRQQMLRCGREQLDAVLLTHEHYDHMAGIDDLRPFCRQGELPVFLESRVAEALRTRMPYCFGPHPYPGAPAIQLCEIETAPFQAAGFEIQPIRGMHYKLPILGYRIGPFAYLTDLSYLPEIAYAKLIGVDTLVVNALRRTPHLAHQTLGEALEMIARVSPRRAYLTHLSHQMGLMDEIAPLLPDTVSVAYDGLEIEV